MKGRTVAGVILVVLLVVLINVYAEGGPYALRSWVAAKFTNRPYARPDISKGRRRRVG